ncbi:MAG: glutamine--fructose-6-phosphate transaminase (isomerizing) [Nanoarchaeota archaeon]
MCGIFGYIGKRDATPLVLKGLKRLEYRGYDSWGIAVQRNGLHVEKHTGPIAKVSKTKLGHATIAIGHTRWATHGDVTKKNAHPHLACKNRLAVVHNGIIENYASLQKELRREGHTFVSDTDSEVLAHLIESCFNGSLETAVRLALTQVQGTYGLLVMDNKTRKIVAARKGSPLMLGIAKDGLYVSSDASPLVVHTKDVIYLDEGEFAVLTDDEFHITDLNNKILKKQHAKLTLKPEQIERHGYKHFMLKEIMEQPESIINTMRGRTSLHFGGLDFLESVIPSLQRIIIVACGTSWYAGMIGKYLIECFSRIPVEVSYASEFRYSGPPLTTNDLVIAISQSGETADTLAALREAQRQHTPTMGIINVVGSTIAREVEGGIYLHAGPEIGVASTKAFTSQVVALYLFALFLAKHREALSEMKINTYLAQLQEVPKAMKTVLRKSDRIRMIAKKYYKSNHFLYLGRGLHYPVAMEGALKLKEISYIHAEGYPAAEMKHGPIALIDKKMPVLFLAPKDKAYDKLMGNLQEVKARGGRIIAVATERDPSLAKLADHVILVPDLSSELSPLLTVLPLQLLAYHIADLRKCNIDKPRNLAKSVTVE